MTQSNCGKNPDCKFCHKKGVKIAVLRTSAVWGTPEALAEVPALPGTVGRSVAATSLSKSKLTVRPLREGYLYQLEKRAGVVGVRAYYITPEGFLYQIDADMPPLAKPEFTCERNGIGGVHASVIAVDMVDSVDRMWLTFVPDPLTPPTSLPTRPCRSILRASSACKVLMCGPGRKAKRRR